MKPINRIRNTAPSIKTRAQADDVLRQIAEVTLRRNAILLEQDEKITAIKDLLGADITACNTLLEQKSDLIRAWAEANPGEFPPNTKSLDTTHAVIGWRTGQPTLKTLAGWTFDRVLEKLKSSPFYAAYIRTKEEVNKQTILGDRDQLTSELLREIGLKIIQDETFFIEPKLTEPENKLTPSSQS